LKQIPLFVAKKRKEGRGMSRGVGLRARKISNQKKNPFLTNKEEYQSRKIVERKDKATDGPGRECYGKTAARTPHEGPQRGGNIGDHSGRIQ